MEGRSPQHLTDFSFFLFFFYALECIPLLRAEVPEFAEF